MDKLQIAAQKLVLTSLQTNSKRQAFLYRNTDHRWVLCILYHLISGLAALSQLTKFLPRSKGVACFRDYHQHHRLLHHCGKIFLMQHHLLPHPLEMHDGQLGRNCLAGAHSLKQVIIFKYPKINFSKFGSVWRQVLMCLNISFYTSLLSAVHTFF